MRESTNECINKNQVRSYYFPFVEVVESSRNTAVFIMALTGGTNHLVVMGLSSKSANKHLFRDKHCCIDLGKV